MNEVKESVQNRTFFQIEKVDPAKREVYGVATSETRDKDGESLDYEGSKPYFKAWSEEARKTTTDPSNPARLSLGNIREMHNSHLPAVGKVTDIQFNDQAKTIHIKTKIVDDGAWNKCAQGVYRGFSIGGKYIGGRPLPNQKYVADPVEISLVDNPCNPDATFAYVKSDGSVEMRKFAKAEELSAEQKRQLVNAALQEKYPQNPFQSLGSSYWICSLYEDYVIVECSGKYFRVPYTISGSDVTLGEPEEVVQQFVPAAKGAAPLWVAKDHAEFHVKPSASPAPDPQLAGHGAGNNNIVDTKPPATEGEVREPGPFDSEDEGWVQDIGKGVSGEDPCPCEDCAVERMTAALDLESCAKADKEDQDYATHNGEKVPRSKHAYAPAGTPPSKWKYPIDKPSRVRNALARWGQHKGIPAAEEPAVARRILAAAKQFGIKVASDDPIVATAKKAVRAEKSECARVSPPISAPASASPARGEKTVTVEELAKRFDEFEKGSKKKFEAIGQAADKLASSHAQMGDAIKAIKGAVGGAKDGESFSPEHVDPQAAIAATEGQHPSQLSAPTQEWKAAHAEMQKSVEDKFASLAKALDAIAGGLAAQARASQAETFELGNRNDPPRQTGTPVNGNLSKGLTQPGASAETADVVKGAETVLKKFATGNSYGMSDRDETQAKLVIMKQCQAVSIDDVPAQVRARIFGGGAR